MDDKPSRRDKRYYRTPVRGVPVRSEDDTPVERLRQLANELEAQPPAVERHGEIDTKALAREIDQDWPHWEMFDKMRHEVDLCRKDRLAKTRRRKWLYGLLGGGVGTFVAAMVFVVKALLAAGASSERSQAQADTVKASAERLGKLEAEVIRLRTLVELLVNRP